MSDGRQPEVRPRLPKITRGMTGLCGNLGRDDGIEEPFWGPSTNIDCEQSLFSQSKFGRNGESEMAERETGDRDCVC